MITLELGKVNVDFGRGIKREVDLASLPKNVLERALYLGIYNMGKDAYAAATEKANPGDFREKSAVMVDRKIAAMISGDLRVNAGGPRESDPVRSEARRLCVAKIKSGLAKKGVTKPTADQIAAHLTDANIDKFMMRAEKIVAERNATEELELEF
jgi:hypothetical protein